MTLQDACSGDYNLIFPKKSFPCYLLHILVFLTFFVARVFFVFGTKLGQNLTQNCLEVDTALPQTVATLMLPDAMLLAGLHFHRLMMY